MTPRAKMMNEIKQFLGPQSFVRTSEDFGVGLDGIWLTNECLYRVLDGLPIYDHDFGTGVNPKFEAFIAERGWTLENYDQGTVLLWPA